MTLQNPYTELPEFEPTIPICNSTHFDDTQYVLKTLRGLHDNVQVSITHRQRFQPGSDQAADQGKFSSDDLRAHRSE